jgi:hypothetical protein
MCSGCVHALKTSERGASKMRLMTSSRGLDDGTMLLLAPISVLLASRDVRSETLQRLAPSANVIVTHFVGFENRLMHCEPGLAGVISEGHRHDGFVAALSSLILKRIGEHETLRRGDFAKYSALAILAAFRRPHPDMPSAADTKIHLALEDGKSMRPPPSHQMLGLCPRLEDECPRRNEDARDDDLPR